MGQLAFAECVLRGADRSHAKIHCALGHSFLPIQVASSKVAESHLEMTMAALLIGYAVLFRSPANLNQSTTRPMEKKMARADQLARLMAFLLLGYFALTAAGALAFTFIW